MDTQLEHDPRTKQQIKDALYAHLYDPVQKDFRTRLETIIQRNCLIGGHSHKHVMFKGALYNVDSTVPPLPRNRLAPALREEMEAYLKDLDQLNNHELPYVLGYINQVLNSSCDMEDYLRVLPESVHRPLLQLQASCPCRTSALSEDKAERLRLENDASIKLMKERMVTNLLI